ncbi:glycoside hydrolase domain-containing protein [Verrucomicrobiota bacterium]
MRTKELLIVTATTASAFLAEGGVTIEARRLPQAPVIDGRLEAVWKHAGQTDRFFETTKGKPARVQTRAHIGFDDDHLYIAFQCDEPHTDELAANVTKHDGELWNDDSVEVFLDVNRDRTHYFHLVVNAAGATSEARCSHGGRLKAGITNKGWNPKWQTAVSTQDKAWTVEVKIPFTELEPGLDTTSEWCVNLCRQRYGKGEGDANEASAASPTMGGFHSPDRFAALHIPFDHVKHARQSFLEQCQRLRGELAKLESAVRTSDRPAAKQLLARVRKVEAERAELEGQSEAIAAGPEKRSTLSRQFRALKDTVTTLSRDSLNLRCMTAMTEVFGVEDPPFGVAVVDTATKVFLHNDLCARVSDTARIALAGNEYEGVQVVLIPFGRTMKDVEVRATDLKSNAGGVLSKSNVHIHPVGYVKTKSSPLDVKFIGWTPDVLLKNGRFDLDDHVQPVWINVYAPPGTPPGIYAGAIQISSGRLRCGVTLEVEVYGFSLPLRSALRTAFHFSWQSVPNFHPKRPADDMIRAYFQTILAHRVSPIGLYANEPSPPRKYVDFCIERGQNTVTLGGYSSSPTDVAAKKYYAYAKSKGWEKDLLFYLCDEPGADQYPGIKARANQIRKAFPGVPTFGATSPREPLNGLLDIWIPVMGTFGAYYIKEDCDARKAMGDDVWMYVCCDPVPPYPNFMIDNDGIDPRIIPWMLWREELTGLLYYYINLWPDVPPEVDFTAKGNCLIENWDTHSYKDYNGDGMLLYPGPCSSVRFENIRDGIEDFEYFAVLKRLLDRKRGRLSPSEIAEAEACLRVDEEIVKDFTVFTKDLRALYGKRERLARMIEKLL